MNNEKRISACTETEMRESYNDKSRDNARHDDISSVELFKNAKLHIVDTDRRRVKFNRAILPCVN